MRRLLFVFPVRASAPHRLLLAVAALGAAWAFEARATDAHDAVAEAFGEVMTLDELCPLLRASQEAMIFHAAANDVSLEGDWLASAVRFHRDKAKAAWGNGRTAGFACATGAALYGASGTKGPGLLVEE